jgi:hypothetical protein
MQVDKDAKRVKCEFCKKPIKAKRFAGVVTRHNGERGFVCDSTLCLIELAERVA